MGKREETAQSLLLAPCSLLQVSPIQDTQMKASCQRSLCNAPSRGQSSGHRAGQRSENRSGEQTHGEYSMYHGRLPRRGDFLISIKKSVLGEKEGERRESMPGREFIVSKHML